MTDTIERLTRALEGRYRLVREVGAGGMATVFLAEDLRHHREVALKVLRPELAATMGPDRFFREIQVAARLQHPHILPLHDSGEADGFLFFVMPYVVGESLRTRLDRVGELPIADAVRILAQVADALSYSHSQGVVHRDIKPDNVMLSGRHALVTDFGVAKAVREAAGESKATTAGVALGTPAYMAPEQAVADPQLDHRVDIYAFGVLAYELLTGRTPFHGLGPAQQLAAHVTETPPPLRKWREACPAELEAIIMRCLAKRAADRFQSADELLQLLEPLAGSSGGTTPTQSRPTPSIATPVATAKRTPRLALGGAFVAIAFSLVTIMLGGKRDAAPPAYERVQLTSSGGAFAPALSPDGTRLAHAERICDRDGLCTSDIRIQDMQGAGGTVLISGLQGVGNIEWSEDGRWVVFSGSVRQRFGMYAILALGGEPRFLGCCSGTLATGDTMLLTDPASGERGEQWLWRLTLSDGRIVDSLSLAPLQRPVVQVFGVPGSDRLLATTEGDDPSAKILLVDRTARLLDSVVVPNLNFVRRPLLPQADGFVVSIAAPNEEALIFLRYPFDGRDRIAADSTVVAKGISARNGVHLTRDGGILVADGPIDWAVVALERDALRAGAVRRRELVRSTSPVTGGIAPQGDRIFTYRPRPSDPGVYELAVHPFEGGPARTFGTLPDVIDYDIAPAGDEVFVVQRLRDQRSLISIAEFASGRVRVLDTLPAGHRGVEALGGGGYLMMRAPRDVVVRRRPDRPDLAFPLPPGAGEPFFAVPSPDAREVAIVGWAPQEDSIAIHRGPLDGSAFRQVGIVAGEGVSTLAWMPDGALLVAVFETQWNLVWYRSPPDGSALTRVELKASDAGSVRFADDGLRGVARERTSRPDIFLLRPITTP